VWVTCLTGLEVKDTEEVETMMIEREMENQAADTSTSVKTVKSSNITLILVLTDN
jgi:hypothetical protein